MVRPAQKYECNWEPPPVIMSVAGKHEMDTKTFQRIYRNEGWRIWCYLRKCRGKDGLTKARNATIQKATGLTKNQVEWHIRRLKRGGVIEVVQARGARACVRRVNGQFSKGQITLPWSAYAKTLKLPGRGGARKGAGRPRKDSNQRLDAGNQRLDPTKIKDSTQASVKRSEKASSRRQAPVEHSLVKDKLKKEPEILSLRERSHAAAARRQDQSPSSPERRAVVIPLRPPQEAPCSVRSDPPRYPDNRLLQVTKIPSPRRFEPDASDDEIADTMATLYKSVCIATFGKKGADWGMLSPKGIFAKKHRQMLLKCGQTLQQYDIAPASWIAWRVDEWRDMAQKKRLKTENQPAFHFVFSTRMIYEAHKRFELDQDGYKGGQCCPTQLSKEVSTRYNHYTLKLSKLARQLQRRGHTVGYGAPAEMTEEAVEAFLTELDAQLQAEFFPGGWEGWYERARESNLEYAQLIKEAIAMRRYVWRRRKTGVIAEF